MITDRIIEVEYDGCYPNTCSGTLTIKVNGETVYNKSHHCYSTGGAWIDDDGDEQVKNGELLWESEEANMFDEEIQEAVQDKLSEFTVCCGGCI